METTENITTPLRPQVERDYEILNLEILIDVQNDLSTAEYTYSFKIKKLRENVEEVWRDIFAYEENDFQAIGAYPGWPTSERNKSNGLGWVVKPLSDEKNNACLSFPISDARSKSEEDIFIFHYICKTKIESLKNLRWFGGSGSVYYWTAQELTCKEIKIRFLLPKNITVVDTMPNPVFEDEDYIDFMEKNLMPRQFFSTLITYEKRTLGISPKYYGIIDRGITLLVGSLLTWGLPKIF